jgi:hypothetical protein
MILRIGQELVVYGKFRCGSVGCEAKFLRHWKRALWHGKGGFAF